MDIAPWLGLASLVDTLGSRRITQLLEREGSAKAAWRANRSALASIGCNDVCTERIIAHREVLDLDALVASAMRERITILTRDDSRFPPLLTQIPDPPVCLFVRGNVDALTAQQLAVVGTRRCSPYGDAAARAMVGPLARSGLAVTSGLAYGIDAAAHRACLDAGGRTIAVLGTGCDDMSIYPAVHRSLAHDIIAHGGTIVSEYVPGTTGRPMHFPARNRIVAGMVIGTLVVEAPADSGALITAQFSIDFGRDVFVVPGPITSPTHAGSHALVKHGAHMVTTPMDIIDALQLNQLFAPAAPPPPTLTGLAARVFNALSGEPTHVDSIATQTTNTAAELARVLTNLELDGVVRDVGGGRYVRIH